MFEKFEDFIDYVFEFYGKGGIYDMGATKQQIARATYILLGEFGEDTFCGDSLDRERIRDIMIDAFGLVFPQGGIKLEDIADLGLTTNP